MSFLLISHFSLVRVSDALTKLISMNSYARSEIFDSYEEPDLLILEISLVIVIEVLGKF